VPDNHHGPPHAALQILHEPLDVGSAEYLKNVEAGDQYLRFTSRHHGAQPVEPVAWNNAEPGRVQVRYDLVEPAPRRFGVGFQLTSKVLQKPRRAPRADTQSAPM
jgi:hypothetical protein